MSSNRCSNSQEPIKKFHLQQQILPLLSNKKPQKNINKNWYKVWVLLKLLVEFKMYPTKMFIGFTSQCTSVSLWKYYNAFATKFLPKTSNKVIKIMFDWRDWHDVGICLMNNIRKWCPTNKRVTYKSFFENPFSNDL